MHTANEPRRFWQACQDTQSPDPATQANGFAVLLALASSAVSARVRRHARSVLYDNGAVVIGAAGGRGHTAARGVGVLA